MNTISNKINIFHPKNKLNVTVKQLKSCLKYENK